MIISAVVRMIVEMRRSKARTLTMTRVTLILLALPCALGAAVPAQDRRNSDVPNTDTKYQAKTYRTIAEWRQRADRLRKQVLSAAGLMPMPERTPLNAHVFGKIEYKDYSIEKVYIETLPGFYLAGNLYRPVGRAGKVPGVLAPHGHAQYGRLENGPYSRCPRGASTWRARAMSFSGMT